jgi:hypothetical protein
LTLRCRARAARIAPQPIKETLAMGLFKNMMGGMNAGQAVADRDSLGGQAHEFNRILTVGRPGQAVIRGHVDAGEQVAGNPVWLFDLEVTPEGEAPYVVRHREIVSTMAMGSYPDGASMACRIDPADPQKVAFGEKPFM